jgi:pleiotropic regulator 1
VRSIVIHHDEYTMASAGSDKIRAWKLPEGDHLRAMPEHNAVVNSLALNRDNVLVSAADNGSMYFFDWASGHNF